MNRLGRADDRKAATVDEDVASDFARMGASVPEHVKEQDDGAFEVWKDNWDSVRAFLAVETQWRAAAGLAGLIWLGLDYTAVDVVLRRMKLPDQVFEDLQLMESEALSVFSEASHDH